jgi:3-methylfumaryl-CoA hydratase
MMNSPILLSGGNIPDPGARLVGFVVVPTEITLFRFSALTWNAHRIHYDAMYARQEGLPGPVVQAHLIGAWFARAVRESFGSTGALRQLEWRNVAPAFVGDSITVAGAVTAVDETTVSCVLTASKQDGQLCASAAALVGAPAASGSEGTSNAD